MEETDGNPPRVLQSGAEVGRYRLLRRLAIGGMAEVYLARSIGIHGFARQLVLKRILPCHAARKELLSMFLDEARLTALISHQNVAQVFDMGHDECGYFITMEYVEGVDVRAFCRSLHRSQRRLPFGYALAIVMGTAAGLHAAHEARRPDGLVIQLVHRDVSPANVMVGFDGSIKVIDFGIAKAAHRETETAAGVLKGKSSFMSPEQCLGEAVDRRSDIFSLGSLLYELTTGRRAFLGRTAYETMRRITRVDLVRPSELIPFYPAELERIVLRALQRRPQDRYRTAREMQGELDQFAREHDLVVSPYQMGNFVSSLPPLDPPIPGESDAAPLSGRHRPRRSRPDEVTDRGRASTGAAAFVSAPPATRRPALALPGEAVKAERLASGSGPQRLQGLTRTAMAPFGSGSGHRQQSRRESAPAASPSPDVARVESPKTVPRRG